MRATPLDWTIARPPRLTGGGDERYQARVGALPDGPARDDRSAPSPPSCSTAAEARASHAREIGGVDALMAARATKQDLATFEALRPELIALAYRMLGDVGRAQDMVQEAWLRWHRRSDVVGREPEGLSRHVVTRLCLNELDSRARAPRGERSDRLPEPIDLTQAGIDRVEALEQVSMAFLVCSSG